MALHRIDVPARDVDPDALGLLVDAPAPAVLAEVVLRNGPATLTLGVLGASHAVTATDGARQITEEVSCDAVDGGGRPLPRRATAPGYRLTSAVRVVPAVALTVTAERLRARAATDPSWLCGAFPGDTAALTVLAGAPARAGGWGWRTWHLYPGREEGVVVTTCSSWAP